MGKHIQVLLIMALLFLVNLSSYAFQERDSTELVLQDSLFNRGNEQDVLGLVSGNWSGLLVSKAGSDPNRPFDALVRGVGTVVNSQSPLIVIDGLVGVSQSMIDLNNIESIRLLKGYETTKYGMQGANGVLEITTKGFKKGELQLDFNQSLYLENRVYKDRVLEREAFLAEGGNDLGANSNWIDIITEAKVSNISNLTARGSTGKLEYLGATNFRLANGILRETGFEQYNFLAKLKLSLSESLSINYRGSTTQKNAELGYDHAFKQAYKANPTQPVYFESGYLYQAIAFEYLNPVGFIDFAGRETEQKVITQSLSVQKQFGASSLSLNAAYFNEGSNYYETIDPTFFYYWGRDYFDANASSRSQYSVNAEFSVGSLSLGSLELKEVVRSGFLKRKFDYLSRRISNYTLVESTDADTISLYNFDVGLTAELKEVLSTEFYLRYENSSALGENKQSALFPSVSLQFNMGSVFSRLKHFKLNASHGASGLTIYDEDLNTTSNNFLYNQDLSYERSLNSDIGFSYQATGQALTFSVTRYKRVSKDILIRNPAFGSSLQYENLGEIENSGWELEAAYDFKILRKPINSRLKVSTLSTEWTEFPFDELIIGYVELRNEFPVIIQKGLPYGSIYALQANYTDDEITLIDTDGQSPVTYRDRTVVGDAMPKSWWAWRNRIALNKTTISFLLEAVHGHDIVNSTNFIRGLNRVYYPSFNILKGGYAFHDESYPLNTAFVERTSFVRLRYIAVDHELTFVNRTLHVYVAANNLFTLTNFKGNDPSPRIKDQFETSYMQLPGIQRTTEWLPSRSFMVGVKVQF